MNVKQNKKLSLIEVISMAVGTIIGASIFSIFGLGANVAYSLAKDGELPKSLERKIWFKSTEGLYITAGLGLAMALFFDLSAIAIITSTIFIIIYMFVLISHFKLTKQYGGNRIIIAFNLIILLTVFAELMKYQWTIQKTAFYASIIIFAFIVEYFFRKFKNRIFKKNNDNT